MTPHIRPRRDDDLPALVAALWQVHTRDAYPSVWPANPLDFIAPPVLGAWVAEVGGQAAGQVLLRPAGWPLPDWIKAAGLDEASASNVAVVSRFFLRPDVRGLGLAQQLLHTACQEAARLGCRAVLDVHQKNLAAIRLYEKEGWQRVATVPAPFTDPDGSTPLVHVYVQEGFYPS